eukprot:3340213-Pyramimonas_sp.AAC.1
MYSSSRCTACYLQFESLKGVTQSWRCTIKPRSRRSTKLCVERSLAPCVLRVHHGSDGVARVFDDSICWARGEQADSSSTVDGTSYPSCTGSALATRVLEAGGRRTVPHEVSRAYSKLPLAESTNPFTKRRAYISVFFSGSASLCMAAALTVRMHSATEFTRSARGNDAGRQQATDGRTRSIRGNMSVGETQAGSLNGRLWAAAVHGRAEELRALVDLGADCDVKGGDRTGTTPLHQAAARGHTDAVRALVELGADYNVKSANGLTPLHAAASLGHWGAVRALAELGADYNVESAEGINALHLAAGGGKVEAVAVLVKLGADINVKGVHGRTPLHQAAARGHVKAVCMLVELGADFNVKAANGST